MAICSYLQNGPTKYFNINQNLCLMVTNKIVHRSRFWQMPDGCKLKYPGVYPKVSNCIQRYPKVPTVPKSEPKVPNFTQDYPKVPNSIQKYPKLCQMSRKYSAWWHMAKDGQTWQTRQFGKLFFWFIFCLVILTWWLWVDDVWPDGSWVGEIQVGELFSHQGKKV